MTAAGDVLVGSDESASFCVTNVLHLMPPLFYARSADVSDVPSEGHHGVASLEWCLYMFGQGLSTRIAAHCLPSGGLQLERSSREVIDDRKTFPMVYPTSFTFNSLLVVKLTAVTVMT